MMTTNIFIPSYPNRGITFVRGEGMYLITEHGEKYLDLGSNYGVNIFGYNHPAITAALEKQLHTLVNLHGSFSSPVRNLAAQQLIARCAGKLTSVFFSNSGAEAVEAALKFARLTTRKSHVIAMQHSYHGKTLGALSATAGDKYRQPFEPLLWNFTHVPFGDISKLEKAITNDTAAVILEPVQGEGGIITAEGQYFQDLMEICTGQKILVITDEIQSGVGRTGTFLAGQQYGLSPDILCLGKGLAGGMPVGATLVTQAIAQKIPLHMHTSTFGGNPLACAGILAALEALKDDILAHVQTTGKYFLKKLLTIKHPAIKEVRGRGLMIGMELTENATPVLKALQQAHIIAIPAGSNIVRFLPPYLITKEEIDRTTEVLRTYFK